MTGRPGGANRASLWPPDSSVERTRRCGGGAWRHAAAPAPPTGARRPPGGGVAKRVDWGAAATAGGAFGVEILGAPRGGRVAVGWGDGGMLSGWVRRRGDRHTFLWQAVCSGRRQPRCRTSRGWVLRAPSSTRALFSVARARLPTPSS